MMEAVCVQSSTVMRRCAVHLVFALSLPCPLPGRDSDMMVACCGKVIPEDDGRRGPCLLASLASSCPVLLPL